MEFHTALSYCCVIVVTPRVVCHMTPVWPDILALINCHYQRGICKPTIFWALHTFQNRTGGLVPGKCRGRNTSTPSYSWNSPISHSWGSSATINLCRSGQELRLMFTSSSDNHSLTLSLTVLSRNTFQNDQQPRNMEGSTPGSQEQKTEAENWTGEGWKNIACTMSQCKNHFSWLWQWLHWTLAASPVTKSSITLLWCDIHAAMNV